MEIRFSRYNEPFVESSCPDIHYISLDNQRLMWAGIYDAHVKLYRMQVTVRTFEAYDHIHGVNYVFECSNSPVLKPFSSSPVVMPIEFDFLDDLYYQSGIKAAGKVSGRVQRPAAFRDTKEGGAVCN